MLLKADFCPGINTKAMATITVGECLTPEQREALPPEIRQQLKHTDICVDQDIVEVKTNLAIRLNGFTVTPSRRLTLDLPVNSRVILLSPRSGILGSIRVRLE